MYFVVSLHPGADSLVNICQSRGLAATIKFADCSIILISAKEFLLVMMKLSASSTNHRF